MRIFDLLGLCGLPWKFGGGCWGRRTLTEAGSKNPEIDCHLDKYISDKFEKEIHNFLISNI